MTKIRYPGGYSIVAAVVVGFGSILLASATISAPTRDNLPQGAPTQPPVGRVPVRPDAADNVGPRAAGEPRVIKGQVRLGKVNLAFKGAILKLTLRRTDGPLLDGRGEKVAELRFFNIRKNVPDADTFIAFSFGDFTPSEKAHYTLHGDLDMNGNGERDAGDYWNERRVDVLTPEDPPIIRIEDLALIQPAS